MVHQHFISLAPCLVSSICHAPSEAANPSANAAYPESQLSRATVVKENHSPAIEDEDQELVAEGKLNTYLAKKGKRPSVVWLVVDDSGFGEMGGPWGGGAPIGPLRRTKNLWPSRISASKN